MIDAVHPSCAEYEACLQSGRGIPVYSGTIMQRGYGVGGLFRSLANGLLPLLPKLGKAVAATALGVASDKMRGIPLSRAIKTRGLAAGKDFLLSSVKKSPRKTVKRRVRPTTKRIRKSDVFGTI